MALRPVELPSLTMPGSICVPPARVVGAFSVSVLAPTFVKREFPMSPAERVMLPVPPMEDAALSVMLPL